MSQYLKRIWKEHLSHQPMGKKKFRTSSPKEIKENQGASENCRNKVQFGATKRLSKEAGWDLSG
jgi:hypothetical protein